jgi:hypothetical protein
MSKFFSIFYQNRTRWIIKTYKKNGDKKYIGICTGHEPISADSFRDLRFKIKKYLKILNERRN